MLGSSRLQSTLGSVDWNPRKRGCESLGTTQVVICFSFRLFGAKAGGKSASAPNTEGAKSSSVVLSPSTSLARQGSLESPSSGTGSMGSAGGLSGSSSPLFNKPSDLTTDVISLSHSLASSPASVHSFTSGGLVWAANLSSSSAGSKDTPSYQSMTSLHTSSESIDLPLSHHGSLSGLTTGTHEVQSLLMRTGSVRSTLSERWAFLEASMSPYPLLPALWPPPYPTKFPRSPLWLKLCVDIKLNLNLQLILMRPVLFFTLIIKFAKVKNYYQI